MAGMVAAAPANTLPGGGCIQYRGWLRLVQHTIPAVRPVGSLSFDRVGSTCDRRGQCVRRLSDFGISLHGKMAYVLHSIQPESARGARVRDGVAILVGRVRRVEPSVRPSRSHFAIRCSQLSAASIFLLPQTWRRDVTTPGYA